MARKLWPFHICPLHSLLLMLISLGQVHGDDNSHLELTPRSAEVPYGAPHTFTCTLPADADNINYVIFKREFQSVASITANCELIGHVMDTALYNYTCTKTSFSLTLFHVRAEDNGTTWECSAHSGQTWNSTLWSNDATLQIQSYGPVRLSLTPSSASVIVDTPVTFTCTLPDEAADADYVAFKRNYQIVAAISKTCEAFGHGIDATIYNFTCTEDTGSYSLTLLNAQKEDNSTEWECSAHSLHSSLNGSYWSNEASLQVQIPPLPPQILHSTSMPDMEVVTGIQGQELIIKCISQDGYPKQTLNWYRVSVDSEPLQSTEVDSELDGLFTVRSYYKFTPTREDDMATFICQSSMASTDQTFVDTAEVKVYLTLQPIGPYLTDTVALVESTSIVTLATCSISGFRPAEGTLMKWSFDGSVRSYTGQPLHDENTDTYSLADTYEEKIDRTDNMKVLMCTISHDTLPGPVSNTTTLKVSFAAKEASITGNEEGFHADGVSMMTLTCTTGTSSPESIIVWYKDDTIIPSDAEKKVTDGEYHGKITSQVLEFVPTRDDDGVVIKCSPDNGIETAQSDSITLDLTYAPIIDDIEDATANESQANVSLVCRASSKPPATFKWFRKNDTSVVVAEGEGSLEHNELVYVMSNPQRTDAGEYECVADNGRGQPDVQIMTLTVNYAPVVTVEADLSQKHTALSIRCVAKGQPSVYMYRDWVQEWKPFHTVMEWSGVGPWLNLSLLTYEHSGIYTCCASNGIVDHKTGRSCTPASTEFFLETPPVVLSLGSSVNETAVVNMSSSLNHTTVMKIVYYSNMGGSVVRAYRIVDGNRAEQPSGQVAYSEIPITLPVFQKTVATNGTMATLSLPIKSLDDFGRYDIVVSNGRGSDTRMMRIVGEDPGAPEPSDDDAESDAMVAVSAVSGSLTLLVVIVLVAVLLRRRFAQSKSTGTQLLTDTEPKTIERNFVGGYD